MERSSFRILGIDPGSQKFGVAVLQVTNGVPTWVELALVKVKGPSFAVRLRSIETELRGFLTAHMPEVVAWEAPFYNYGTRNADACIQLSKAVGVGERLLPDYGWVEEGYECQPSSTRKVLGVPQGNYFLLRAALAAACPAAAESLEAGVDREKAHDKQPAAVVPCDTVSAMVQAWALHSLIQAGSERKGIEQVYRRCETKPERRVVQRRPPPGGP